MDTIGLDASLRVHDILNEGWIGAVLLGAIAVLAWTNVSARKKWNLLREAVFRLRLGQQTMRDDISLRDRGLIALLFTAMVLIALFVYQLAVQDSHLGSGFAGFLPVLLSVVIVTVGQASIIRFTSWFFKADPGLGEYLYTSLLLTAAVGIALLPPVLVIAYQPSARNAAAIVGAVVLGAMVLYRWFRAVLIGLGQGVGPGSIFLYICAAEILPAALAAQALAHFAHLPSDPV
ncbi:MAG: DUF4271 domain-containing protein [Flavobacteriales bacterium]